MELGGWFLNAVLTIAIVVHDIGSWLCIVRCLTSREIGVVSKCVLGSRPQPCLRCSGWSNKQHDDDRRGRPARAVPCGGGGLRPTMRVSAQQTSRVSLGCTTAHSGPLCHCRARASGGPRAVGNVRTCDGASATHKCRTTAHVCAVVQNVVVARRA